MKNPAQIYQTSGRMSERPVWNACIANSIHVLESIENTQLQPTKSHPGILNLWQLAFQLMYNLWPMEPSEECMFQ